jgi:hypothetical protein
MGCNSIAANRDGFPATKAGLRVPYKVKKKSADKASLVQSEQC